MLRFFPPVVTGTIIVVIGISLMRIGINWIFGNPFGPTAPSIVNPDHAKWLTDAAAAASAAGSPMPKDLALLGKMPNPKYADLSGVGIASLVLVSILLISKFAKGFVANISVLLGIVIGAVVAARRHHHSFALFASTAGTLFALDAWFDVTTAHQGSARGSLLVAAFEIPFAMFLWWSSHRATKPKSPPREGSGVSAK